MWRVRPARPEDAADVAAIHVRSWQVGYRGLISDGYLDSLRPEDRMARYTFGSRDPRQPFTFVAIEDDVLCGFATAGPSRDTDVPQRGELFALYVDPPAWGRGTGRRLIVPSREHLCRGGFTEAVLWVLVGNDRAERFYRADGWLPDGRRQSDEIWGVTVDETCYRRDLP